MQGKTPIEKILLDSKVDWRAWPIVGPPTISSQFKEGLNHQTLLLESAGKKYVLKIFESPLPNAIAAQRWAAKRSLSPQVLYAPKDGRYLLMDFVEGRAINESISDDGDLSAIAKHIKAVHQEEITQTNIACGYFNYSAYCDYYLQKSDKKICEIHKQLLAALDIFIQDKTPLKFCHNDLVLSNWLMLEGEASLLDWDYAQINNPWFDLASIIYYCRLNSAQSLSFLSAYDSSSKDQHEQAIFYAAQCAVLWIDILWNLDKFGQNCYSKLTEKLDHLRQLAKPLNVDLDV